MAKKERLGSDPLKDSPLGWIQDTREESEKKEPKKDKNNDVITSKRQNVKEPKRLNAKTSAKNGIQFILQPTSQRSSGICRCK